MYMHSLFFILPFLLLNSNSAFGEVDFTFFGFNSSDLILDGAGIITSDGLLDLTNRSTTAKGHAFYPTPLKFKSQLGELLSFSTTFVFAINGFPSTGLSGHGLAFVLSPTTNFSSALPTQYLGLFNTGNNGNESNHILAIELDTVCNPEFQEIDTACNPEFQEIDDNHVGININSLISHISMNAGYYDDGTGYYNELYLKSGKPIQVWVDFDARDMKLNVTISPTQDYKPNKPLLSSTILLSDIMLDSMYVGFSSSTGPFPTSHYIHKWRFKLNSTSGPLGSLSFNPSQTPINTKHGLNILIISWPIVTCLIVLSMVAYVKFIVKRRVKHSKMQEDWELQYGPHRFAYKDLYHSNKGFNEKELLGVGGFGKVYRGILPPNTRVAVKRISHDSKQGIREFVAEVLSIGKLRHRNIVQLLGYCRHKNELLLVYDYMPNGSLDKLLHEEESLTLDWAQRFKVIKGVASGLLYLHEDWEQVVIHRDIKASNVLLDSEMNGRFGDFGLSRLYNHGSDVHSTRVAGTIGYLAPELARTGKSTTATDVFAFGVFLLEVVCGRRPINRCAQEEDMILVDWVLGKWQQGQVLTTVDCRLGEEYSVDEAELVLKLGLFCSNPMHAGRPNMRSVVQFLEGDKILPESPSSYSSIQSLIFETGDQDFNCVKATSSVAASISSLSGGR